jgi:tetratricopeptide (TPR) repeat protein
LPSPQQVVAARPRTEDGDRTGRFRSNLGTTLTQLGRYREAVSLLREAVAASARHGSIGVQVECLTSLASVLRRMGIYAEAESLVLRAKTLDTTQDGGPASVYTLLTMSELYLDMGRVAEADDACRGIARMLTGHPSKYYLARLAFRQAGVANAEGDTERAEAALQHGLRLVEDVNGWRHLVVYSCQLAKLYLDTGRPDLARTAVQRAAGIKRYQTSETLALQARLLCRLHSHAGEHQRAVRLGQQAADVFGAMPDPLRQARSLEVLADAYDAHGDAEAASRCRYEAAAILHRLRLGPPPTSTAPDPIQSPD